MTFSVQMPALGESVSEGTITRWLKQEGDTVEVDEPLLEVSTDKVDTEIPSPTAGVVQRIVAQEDDTVEIGGELAVVGDSSEGGGGSAPAQQESAQQEPAQQQPAPQEPAQQPAQPEPEPAAQGESSGGSAQASSGTDVSMPALGESVSEGTVTRWLKQVGDTVEVDEPLLEVSTDKVDTEVPSPVAGTVLELAAGEDDTVEVGSKLAVVGAGGAAAQPAQPEQQAQPAAAAQPQPEPQAQPAAPAQPQQPAAEPQRAEPQQPAQQPAQQQPARNRRRNRPSRPPRRRPPRTTSPRTRAPAASRTSRRWSASSRPSTASTCPR